MDSQFVLARWSVGHEVRLLFVPAENGKPCCSFGTTHLVDGAHKWRSYHAAKKYQRGHLCLTGFVVFNLTELQSLHDAALGAAAMAKFEPM